jgi:GWxTD domain-containing protein
LIALILVIGSSNRATGQSLDTLLREVAAASNEAALERLAARALNAIPGNDPGLHVIRGFIALRRHEIAADTTALSHARQEFDRARKLDDGLALAHYGYGLSLQRSPNVAGTILATGRAWSRMLSFDDRSTARRAFERALELDPGLSGAAVALSEVALQSMDPAELRSARDALVRPLAGRVADDKLLAALSRVAAALGDLPTAVAIADQFTAADTPAELLHSRLWVLAPETGRERDAGEAYFRLVDRADGGLLARVYLEMQPILLEKEKTNWREADLEARRALLRDAWGMRAALAGTTVAERIAEHWRRLAAAVRRYPRQAGGLSPINALETSRLDAPFDDRGTIYVRHGEPDEVIATWSVNRLEVRVTACTGRNVAFRGNESWVYRKPDGTRVMYHFARCFDMPDFMLLNNVPCSGPWAAERLGYDMGLTDCTQVAQERIRRQAREALASDSHRPRFGRRLPVAVDLLAFRGTQGRTDMLFPLGLGADSLTPHAARGLTVYRVDVTASVIDTASGRIAQLDTAIAARSDAALAPGQLIRTHVQLSVVPTLNAQLRLTVHGSVAGEGNFYGTDIRVPDYGGDSLMVSSIVLATPDSGGAWHRGTHALTLMPLGQFEGGVFRVFYEIYNLEAERAYVTEITVEPTGRGGPQPIRLRFQDFARPEKDGVVRDLRRVDSGLRPGRYRITVQVTDPQALRSARADHEFVVTERPSEPSVR